MVYVELLDYLHFINKSMQFRINFRGLSSYIFKLYLPFRVSLIAKITSPATLSQCSIPQLTVLLHNLITLKEAESTFMKIIDDLILKMELKPFCTCFHLILLNNHLSSLEKNELNREERDKIASLKGMMRKVVKEQLPVIINYIDMMTIIQLYNFIDVKEIQMRSDLLKRAMELLP